MTRSWDESRYQGGLGDLADDEDAFDSNGTVDLGHGTVGGEYNVTEGGHTVSDEQVANSDRLEYSGNDTVTVTGSQTDQQTNQNTQQVGDAVAGSFSGGDNTTLLLIGAVGLVAVYLGVSD